MHWSSISRVTTLPTITDKKATTPKRRKSVHSDGGSAGSPPALTPSTLAGSAVASAQNKTPGRLSVPLSERQQMALIMQQFNAEHTSQGGTCMNEVETLVRLELKYIC